jgi:hypothetical protein
MSQVRILSPRPLIFMELFWAGCLRFQMQNARGSRNGSSFTAVKSREISSVLGCQRTTGFVGRRYSARAIFRQTGITLLCDFGG